MSMFSFPQDLTANEMMKSMTAMTERAMTDWGRRADFAIPPLMVYPLGAAAAATAVGFGIAGQMTGLAMGTMQGAMASQAALMGRRPDLSWIMPTLAEDLAPEDAADEPEVAVAATAKSADVVTLKAVDQPAPAKAKAKPVATKAKPVEKPAKSAAAVEKLKADAEVAAAGASETAPAPVKEGIAPALAPEDFVRPAEIDKPATPDDLKAISGIGPKLEQVLNGLGVWTYAQIAAWTPEEVAWVDDYLQFSGRVERDDWIAQADALAKGAATAG
ncbi:NADH-ubiquinone dehydrogenase [Hoeflea olei]|uniref:NADH-ubiquinone dehydrogenase n=1 Tax=Hoeflea olei TaxID=1480615 RepID=A0A1C1YZ52_9HYPH|nr:NADH-ubiquinone dehydrogenase [Hoeflea olei]OCW58690.1 hypothetical protein AWJ14_00190 [Hoeflea olei]